MSQQHPAALSLHHLHITRNHAACVQQYCEAVRRGRHFCSLLAQFGLTPKCKRALVAGEAVCCWMRYDGLAKDQPAEITMFQMSEVQELPAFNGRRSFLPLRAGQSGSTRHEIKSCKN